MELRCFLSKSPLRNTFQTANLSVTGVHLLSGNLQESQFLHLPCQQHLADCLAGSVNTWVIHSVGLRCHSGEYVTVLLMVDKWFVLSRTRCLFIATFSQCGFVESDLFLVDLLIFFSFICWMSCLWHCCEFLWSVLSWQDVIQTPR